MYTFRDRQDAARGARRLSGMLWLISMALCWCLIDYLSWIQAGIMIALFLACIIISKRIGILIGRYNLPERDVDLFVE